MENSKENKNFTNKEKINKKKSEVKNFNNEVIFCLFSSGLIFREYGISLKGSLTKLENDKVRLLNHEEVENIRKLAGRNLFLALELIYGIETKKHFSLIGRVSSVVSRKRLNVVFYFPYNRNTINNIQNFLLNGIIENLKLRGKGKIRFLVKIRYIMRSKQDREKIDKEKTEKKQKKQKK